MKQSHRAFLCALIIIAPHVSSWVAMLMASVFIVVAMCSGDSA